MISLTGIFSEKRPSAEGLAQNARARRLGLDMSQEDLSKISDVPLATLKRFEKTGKVSLPSFVAICTALGVAEELHDLIPPAPPKTLDEVDGRKPVRPRKRASGRTRRE